MIILKLIKNNNNKVLNKDDNLDNHTINYDKKLTKENSIAPKDEIENSDNEFNISFGDNKKEFLQIKNLIDNSSLSLKQKFNISYSDDLELRIFEKL